MPEEKRQLPLWQESLLLVATALVLALIVKTFFFQAFYIPSDSMVPTMVKDDKLLVQKWSYWSGGPERGDIVVFRDPGNWLGEDLADESSNAVQRGLELVGLFPSGGHLIKRVVGVGGDRVVCCDAEGRTTVNGEPVDEPYLADQDANADQTFDIKVPKGYLWVQGDNRGNSADSRAHLGEPGGGFIADDDVVGKAWLRVWPFNRFGVISGSDAFDEVP
ncbi:hypothetical protein AFL01nite_22080 [Aeromicrobium flavum]|uniref:Signal peptidase I n=1 Tax=Aeromicrobium flavum TaxID=416568 RepID=A0A512HWS0_9ACTN|nr:signal peptidase I [Aeromicrobium flavum]GEO89881.1 hypothetical protein AFL01nite_22080 [Aeromicrobium flavum]